MIKYSHTNLIASDWKRLARFYTDVFGCEQLGPIRSLSGVGVSGGTGVENACLEGVHLKFPGFGSDGPTLEIFQYEEAREREMVYANSRGLTHLAFEVTDMDETCSKVIGAGGWMLGKLVSQVIDGVGVCTFVYVRDPDRNIIEIQTWDMN
jgi:catechol 2,3-dioxygenase-like lactoylglutathione lyase family enzyme